MQTKDQPQRRGKTVDLAGEVINGLTVVERAGMTAHGAAVWRCKCPCGDVHAFRESFLLGGAPRSTGCGQ
jgi:hypothetical protein